MELFRLRVRNPMKKGHTWEIHMFPEHSSGRLLEADGRILGSSTTPEAILWLKKVSESFLLRAVSPSPIAVEDFGPKSEPRWLRHEDGMRLALAFSAARYLVIPKQKKMFAQGLRELPSEVVLYWFTLCFYGYRQAAGRAALRTLLTHDEPETDKTLFPLRSIKKSLDKNQMVLFGERENPHANSARRALAEYSEKVSRNAAEESSNDDQSTDKDKHRKKTSTITNAKMKRGKKS